MVDKGLQDIRLLEFVPQARIETLCNILLGNSADQSQNIINRNCHRIDKPYHFAHSDLVLRSWKQPLSNEWDLDKLGYRGNNTDDSKCRLRLHSCPKIMMLICITTQIAKRGTSREVRDYVDCKILGLLSEVHDIHLGTRR